LIDSTKGEMGTGWFFNRDKASLDGLRLRDESLEESDNLPDPYVLAQEIFEDLEAALEQFREIGSDLGTKVAYGEDESGRALNVWNGSPPFFHPQWLSVSYVSPEESFSLISG
jgi:hypothetical protein